MSAPAVDHKGSRFRRRRCWEIWNQYLVWGNRPTVNWLDFDAAFHYNTTTGLSIRYWPDGQTAIVYQNGTIRIWLGDAMKVWFEWTDGKLSITGSETTYDAYKRDLAALEFKPDADEPDFSCNGIETDPGFAPAVEAADAEGTRDITDVIREIARGS